MWLEVGEHAAIDRLGLMRELGQQVRPLGAKLGLEHAGARLAQTERLYEAGLDYIKLDASMSLGIVDDRPRTDFLRGLVSMLHGLGALVYAEGVSQTADAEVLWACGIDGMTGPWVGSALRPGA